MAVCAKKLSAQLEDVFDPLSNDASIADSWTGERKKLPRVGSIPLRWPKGKIDRYNLFDAWHDVAMQIVHRNKCSFRLMAVTKKVINWQQGTIKQSNAHLAARAGACSEKTISREVQQYVSLGILIVETGSRVEDGQVFRTRTLRPALPARLEEGVLLPEFDGFDLDNSGPIGSDVDLDNSGPVDLDNSGPITIETNTRLMFGRQQCS